MPLSFASILGGMITLIGTPPNIIIASFREQADRRAFRHVRFFAGRRGGARWPAWSSSSLIGWRLIPQRSQKDAAQELFALPTTPHEDYIAEVRVGEDASVIDRRVRDLDAEADEADVAIIGLVRNGKRSAGRAARAGAIRQGDILVIVQADAEHIDAFVGALKLEYVGSEKYVGHAPRT